MSIREQIMVVMGLDTAPLKGGLNKSKAAVSQWQRGMSATFSRLAGQFAAIFGITKMLAGLKAVSAELDKLYEKMNVQRLKEENRRNSMQGLSKADVESIVAGDIEVSKMTDAFHVASGKIVGYWSFAGQSAYEAFSKAWKDKDPTLLFTGWDQAMAKAADKQRDAIMEAEKLARIDQSIKATEEAKARNEKENLDIRKKITESYNEQIRRAKELRSSEENLNRILKSRIDAINAAASGRRNALDTLNMAKTERGKFSLADLAELDITRHTSAEQASNIDKARRVQFLEQDARLADQYGNVDYAAKVRQQADEIRKGITSLTHDERYQFDAMEKDIRTQTETLSTLLTTAQNDGLRVVPAD